MWFAGAEEVEVGPVEEEDAFGHFSLLFVVPDFGKQVCA